MKIIVMEKQAFVQISKDYLVCIGTREEVEKSTDEQVIEMVRTAFAQNAFNEIETSKHQVH